MSSSNIPNQQYTDAMAGYNSVDEDLNVFKSIVDTFGQDRVNAWDDDKLSRVVNTRRKSLGYAPKQDIDIQKFRKRGFGDVEWLKNLGDVGGATTIYDAATATADVYKAKTGDMNDPETVAAITRLKQRQFEDMRGTTMGYNIGTGIAQVPAFGAEIALSGGAITAGKSIAKSGLKGLTRAAIREVAKTAAERASKRGVLAATGHAIAEVPLRAPVFAPKVYAQSVLDTLPSDIQITQDEAGQLQAMLEDPQMGFGDALLRNALITGTEVWSEGMGPTIGAVIDKMAPGARKALTGKLVGGIARKARLGGKPVVPAVQRAFQQMQIGSFGEEWLEEDAGQFAQYAITQLGDMLGIEGMDLGVDESNIYTGGNFTEEALTRGAVLAVPQAGRGVLNRGVRAAQSARGGRVDIITGEMVMPTGQTTGSSLGGEFSQEQYYPELGLVPVQEQSQDLGEAQPVGAPQGLVGPEPQQQLPGVVGRLGLPAPYRAPSTREGDGFVMRDAPRVNAGMGPALAGPQQPSGLLPEPPVTQEQAPKPLLGASPLPTGPALTTPYTDDQIAREDRDAVVYELMRGGMSREEAESKANDYYSNDIPLTAKEKKQLSAIQAQVGPAWKDYMTEAGGITRVAMRMASEDLGMQAEQPKQTPMQRAEQPVQQQPIAQPTAPATTTQPVQATETPVAQPKPVQANTAPATPATEAQPTDLNYTSTGKPYKTQGAARTGAKRAGATEHEVVPVNGGYAWRKRETQPVDEMSGNGDKSLPNVNETSSGMPIDISDRLSTEAKKAVYIYSGGTGNDSVYDALSRMRSKDKDHERQLVREIETVAAQYESELEAYTESQIGWRSLTETPDGTSPEVAAAQAKLDAAEKKARGYTGKSIDREMKLMDEVEQARAEYDAAVNRTRPTPLQQTQSNLAERAKALDEGTPGGEDVTGVIKGKVESAPKPKAGTAPPRETSNQNLAAWQMTFEEFLKKRGAEKGMDEATMPRGKYQKFWSDFEREARYEHVDAVEKAIKRGDAVPARVLVKYSGLVRTDLTDDQHDEMVDDTFEITPAEAKLKAIKEWVPRPTTETQSPTEGSTPGQTTTPVAPETGEVVSEPEPTDAGTVSDDPNAESAKMVVETREIAESYPDRESDAKWDGTPFADKPAAVKARAQLEAWVKRAEGLAAELKLERELLAKEEAKAPVKSNKKVVRKRSPYDRKEDSTQTVEDFNRKRRANKIRALQAAIAENEEELRNTHKRVLDAKRTIDEEDKAAGLDSKGQPLPSLTLPDEDPFDAMLRLEGENNTSEQPEQEPIPTAPKGERPSERKAKEAAKAVDPALVAQADDLLQQLQDASDRGDRKAENDVWDQIEALALQHGTDGASLEDAYVEDGTTESAFDPDVRMSQGEDDWSQRDAEYLATLESGDMGKARELAEEAAKDVVTLWDPNNPPKDFVLHRIESNPEKPLNPPRMGRTSNVRSMYGLFFTTGGVDESNLGENSQYDVYEGHGLKLFDRDRYGSGSWDDESSHGKTIREKERLADGIKKTKEALIARGYDGMILHEKGFGFTVVVFPESISKVNRIEAVKRNASGKPLSLSERFLKNGKPVWYSSRQNSTRKPTGNTVDTVSSTLSNSQYGLRVKKLLKSGKLKIVQTADETPAGGAVRRNGGRVEGVYDPKTDTMYIVADGVRAGDEVGALQHEAFHRAMEQGMFRGILDELDQTLQDDAVGRGKGLPGWLQNAVQRARVEKKPERFVEEVAAYSLNNYDSVPKTIKDWVDKFIAKVKATLFKTLGVRVGKLDPAMLRELAVYGLSDRIKAREGYQRPWPAPNSKRSMAMDEDSAKRDRDYLAAVERGDTETAQRMVDEESEDQYDAVERELQNSADDLASLAQEEYDAWDQDGDGHSEELGTGGICELIAERFSGYLYEKGFNIEQGGQDGDDHAWIFASKHGHSFIVDISPYVYESGGGYSWRKRPGVVFDGKHVDIVRTGYVDVYGEPYAADPVTYDDAGNVIPLSERFQADNEDIRYSIADAEVDAVDWTAKMERAKREIKEEVQSIKDNVRLVGRAMRREAQRISKDKQDKERKYLYEKKKGQPHVERMGNEFVVYGKNGKPAATYQKEEDALDHAYGLRWGARKDTNEKQDISKLDTTLKTRAFYHHKVWQLERTTKAAEDSRDAKANYENDMFDGEEDANGDRSYDYGFLKAIYDRMDSQWQKINDYIYGKDLKAESPKAKLNKETDKWEIYNTKGELVETMDNTDKEGLGSERAAWNRAHDIEMEEMRKSGSNALQAKAVRTYRTITDRMYYHLLDNVTNAVRRSEEMGLPEPTTKIYEPDENGKMVRKQITLMEAVRKLGDQRGHYMPRVRKGDFYLLKAVKDGEGELLEIFSNDGVLGQPVSGRRKRAFELEEQGYTVTFERNTRLSEEVYLDASLVSMSQMIQKATAELDKREWKSMTFEKLGIETETIDYEKKDGTTEKQLVIRMPENAKAAAIFKKEFSGGWWGKKEGLGYDAWRFAKRDGKTIQTLEREIAQRVAMSTYPEMAAVAEYNKLLTMHIAQMFHERGSRQRMIGRSEAKGDDVVQGYERDTFRALTVAVKSTAGGTAKRDFATEAMKIQTGTLVSWADWQESHPLPEGVERGSDEYEEAAKQRWNDYQDFVEDQKIDAALQPNAYKENLDFSREFLRNQEPFERKVGIVRAVAAWKYMSGLATAIPNISAMASSVIGTFLADTKAPMGEILRTVFNEYKTAIKLTQSAWKAHGFDTRKPEFKWVPKEDQRIYKHINKNKWDEAQFHQQSMEALTSNLERRWKWLVDWSMVAFSVTERVNRASTIASAYKLLAKQEQGPISDARFEELMLEAKKLSDKAHGVYGKEDDPAAVRGSSLGAVALRSAYMFKKFPHTYLQNMGRMMGEVVKEAFQADTIGGGIKALKKREAQALGWMLLSPALIAGGGATIATPALAALASGVFMALGQTPPDDPEEAFYDWISENFGETSGNWARHGAVGLGGYGVNLKGSLQIGITDLPTSIRDFLGAPASVFKDLYEGTGYVARGDVLKGAERLAPRMLAGPIRGYREATEGATTPANQPVFYGDERVVATPVQQIIRSLGFNPSGISRKTEEQWAERKTEQAYTERRSDIYAQIRAFVLKPERQRSKSEEWDILMQIKEYNARVKQSGDAALPGITHDAVKAQITKAFKPSKRERIRAGEKVEEGNTDFSGVSLRSLM